MPDDDKNQIASEYSAFANGNRRKDIIQVVFISNEYSMECLSEYWGYIWN